MSDTNSQAEDQAPSEVEGLARALCAAHYPRLNWDALDRKDRGRFRKAVREGRPVPKFRTFFR